MNPAQTLTYTHTYSHTHTHTHTHSLTHTYTRTPKVAVASTVEADDQAGAVAVAAVIFKNKAMVSLYTVDRTGRVGAGTAVEHALPAPPCDVCFVGRDLLMLLLPKPHYVQVLAVGPFARSGGAPTQCDAAGPAAAAFAALCADKGLDFSQQLVGSADGGGDGERGIRKHALDRPFTRNTGIDPDKKKGAKRSRRRGPDE